jgi:hypothetical protein
MRRLLAAKETEAAPSDEEAARSSLMKRLRRSRLNKPMKKPGSGPADVRAYVEVHDGVLPRDYTDDVEQRRAARIMRNTIRDKATIPNA